MRFVSSLSEAISTAMWRVSLVTVAWIRRWYFAVAELHQGVAIEPQVRDVPLLGRLAPGTRC